MTPDITDKLRQIQSRRLVAELCRRCDKTRTWFYKVTRGKASLIEYLEHIDAVLGLSDHPIAAERELLGLSQFTLAEHLGVSRQTVAAWEREPSRQERLDRVLALRKTLRAAV